MSTDLAVFLGVGLTGLIIIALVRRAQMKLEEHALAIQERNQRRYEAADGDEAELRRLRIREIRLNCRRLRQTIRDDHRGF